MSVDSKILQCVALRLFYNNAITSEIMSTFLVLENRSLMGMCMHVIVTSTSQVIAGSFGMSRL